MKKNSAPLSGAVSAVAAALLLAGALAGCSDDGAGGKSSKSAAPGPKKGAAATVGTRSGDLGTFLVDDDGRTLYLFEADKSSKSTCYGGCAKAWPPLTVSGSPKASGGVKADLLGTTTRKDGKKQATYNGHPLYYYEGDSKAGDTNGEDLDQFGAEWYVLDKAGDKIEEGGKKDGDGDGDGGTSGGY